MTVVAGKSVHRVASLAAAALIAALATIALGSPAAASSGTWTLDTSANPQTFDRFEGVACPDATHCWAVGTQDDGSSGPQTLIEQSNGSTTWTVQTSANINPAMSTQDNTLRAVTCVSVTDCWAVGDFFDTATGFEQPLREHYDGATWTASTFAVPIANGYTLEGVSCVNANACWAVGELTSPIQGPYIERWDGTTWTPQSVEAGGFLASISCADTTHCKAVGNDSNSPSSPLILTYNGTIWSADTSVTTGTAGRLAGVWCTSATMCWAVGDYRTTVGLIHQNLLESWNGTAWTLSSSGGDNNTSVPRDNQLNGVTCTSATACLAVGMYFDSTTADRTLIDTWDGTTWSVVPGTPNTAVANRSDDLAAVSCGVSAPTTHCAAVGDYFVPDPTLVLSITVTAATAIPVPPTGASPSPGPGLPLGVLLVIGGALAGAAALASGGRRRHQQVP